ncbi:MAG: peptidase domain-containing ABC transporter [Deltaproteobacteria bacterium]|nr:peptidase domain-containing ABC transporter [Deltaproteobacteria bacterium]
MPDPKLGARSPRPRRARLRYVQQLEAADCGAACLAMVLGYWGHDAPLARVRETLAVSGAGVTAKAIVEGAAHFGLSGRGVKIEVEQIRYLPPGSIVHWSFGHWIVLERVEARGVRVVDPAGGRRLIAIDQFRRKFTGVALVFTPNARFVHHRGKRHSAWPYIKRLFADQGLLVQVLMMTGLLQLLGMLMPLVMGVVVDKVVPRSDLSLLTVLGLGCAVVVGFSLMATLARMHLLVKLRTTLDFQLATRFIEHLTSLPYAFFQRRQTGDLMMRVNSNAQIREFLTSSVVSSLLDALLVLGYLAVIALVSPTMAALVLALGAARVLVLLVVQRRLTDSMAAQLDASARAQGFLAEMIAGIETLKVAGRERTAVGRWTNMYTGELEEAARRSRLDGTVGALLGALGSASPLVVLGTGAWLATSNGMTLGTMLAVVALATAFLTPLSALVSSGIQLSLLDAYLERVEDVLEAEPEQAHDERRVTPARLRGYISLRNVSFRYGRDQPLVLENISLDIRPGQTVAIVGESGSGKTTLANLLLGLYLPCEGEIRFDGQRIGDLDLAGLRRRMGVVSQHPYLFAGTVRDNITLGDDETPLTRVVAAARSARIHDDIVQLPMAYESLLPDRGESLSGGQRQRIALARAIVARPSVLLLDEATSALDTRTEQEITASIERLQCTRIVIAHRLSTIARADLIVVMHRGRIAEIGRHEDLVDRGDVYRSLVLAQSSVARGTA